MVVQKFGESNLGFVDFIQDNNAGLNLIKNMLDNFKIWVGPYQEAQEVDSNYKKY